MRHDMPKHDQPKLTHPFGTSVRGKARWQDLNHGPQKGQRRGTQDRSLRVPGKGSGR